MIPLDTIPSSPPKSLYASLIGKRFCAITNLGRVYAEGALTSLHWAPQGKELLAKLDSGHLVPFRRLVYAEPVNEGTLGSIGAPRFQEDELDEKIKGYLFKVIEQVVSSGFLEILGGAGTKRIYFTLFELVAAVEGTFSVAGGSRCGKRLRRFFGDIFNVAGTAWKLRRNDRGAGSRYHLEYLHEGETRVHSASRAHFPTAPITEH